MTRTRTSHLGAIGALAAGLTVAACAALAAARPAGDAAMSAADAIRAAVLSRMGAGAEVSVTVLDLTATTNVFRDARPDPAARLGHSVRFTLMTTTGAALPATATVHVFVDHAVVRRAVERGTRLSAEDLDAVRSEIVDGPLRRLPTAAELTGAEALRPLTPGTIVLGTFAKIRRPVEPGDRVTVMALAGAVEVTASFVAADGGNAGDVIRVVNPETRRYLRGRVIKSGLVEVGE